MGQVVGDLVRSGDAAAGHDPGTTMASDPLRRVREAGRRGRAAGLPRAPGAGPGGARAECRRLALAAALLTWASLPSAVRASPRGPWANPRCRWQLGGWDAWTGMRSCCAAGSTATTTLTRARCRDRTTPNWSAGRWTACCSSQAFTALLDAQNLSSEQHRRWDLMARHDSGQAEPATRHILGPAYTRELDRLQEPRDQLADAGLTVAVDLGVVRSHEYYTGVSLEVMSSRAEPSTRRSPEAVAMTSSSATSPTTAAPPYDAQTVSIWTLDGRIKNVRFACSRDALKQLTKHCKGESDLIRRDGQAVPDRHHRHPRARDLRAAGLDRAFLRACQRRYRSRRRPEWLSPSEVVARLLMPRSTPELQAKRTRSAVKLLKKRARREARHAIHINHKIAKTVVAVAQRTERGIALEELGGIRKRVTVSRDQRARQSSWPFHQLGSFLEYKARRSGVPFIEVDPRYTSQRCPRCGHTERANRPTRDHFSCRRCGLAGPAEPRRRGQHRQARGHGVGIRQHARSGPRIGER